MKIKKGNGRVAEKKRKNGRGNIELSRRKVRGGNVSCEKLCIVVVYYI